MTRWPPATLLFDVDGTLIDSNEAHAEAWSQALGNHGVAAGVGRIRPLIGMGGDKLLPALAHVSEDSELGQAIVRDKKAIFARLLPGLQPTRGARALLEYLREQHVALGIATSSDDRELSALLRQARVDDLFPKRTSKDDAEQSKPDPDIVQAALAQSGARRDQTMMVGDTPYDIEAAHRADIDVIALRCGGYWGDSSLYGALDVFDDPQTLLLYWRGVGPDGGAINAQRFRRKEVQHD